MLSLETRLAKVCRTRTELRDREKNYHKLTRTELDQLTPQLPWGSYFWSGVALVLIFMFIARPVTVFCCALPDRRARWSFNELLFMCWTRETGVIPGALAGILVGMKVPGAEIIASVTFITILLTIIVQATTTRWLAGRLGLLIDPSSGN